MINEEKAAVMLLSLEEGLAAEVMKNLRPAEIRRIGKYMNQIKMIPAETITSVAKEFIVMTTEKIGNVSVRDDVTKDIVTRALGEKNAQGILSAFAGGAPADNPITEKLREIDTKTLMEFAKTEHPQTIAVILAHMAPEQAAVMLEGLPGPLQIEIAKRMATLQAVPHEFLEDVAMTLEKELVTDQVIQQPVGGVNVMSEILNRMSRSGESTILASLEEEDAALANMLRELTFTFEDVLKIDDKSLQELLREISTEDLAKALKMIDECKREKIYRNMSKRGAEMLREDIDMMPPIRISEVESSQRTILELTKKLEADGRIVLPRGNEEDQFV